MSQNTSDDDICRVESKQSDQDSSLDQECPKTRVHDIMKPQLVTMRLFGIYHERHDLGCMKAYCVMVQAICWLNFVRSLLTFNFFYGVETKFDKHFVKQLVAFVWTFVGASSSTLLYCLQEARPDCTNGISAFIAYCDHLINYSLHFKKSQDLDRSKLIKKLSFLRSLSAVLSLSGVLFIAFNVGLMVTALFSPQLLIHSFLEYVSPMSYYKKVIQNIYFKIVIAFFTVYSAVLPSFTVFYFISNSAVLITLLSDYNQEFRRFIALNSCISLVDETNEIELTPEASNRITKESFEKMRQWHVKLCYAVRLLNRCFNKIVAIIIFFMVRSDPIEFIKISSPTLQLLE